MAGMCTGRCNTFDDRRTFGGGKMYARGYSRCTNCECFFKWEGIFCPCCRQRIRKTQRTRSDPNVKRIS